MQYYIAENGQSVGPFEIHELFDHGLTVNSQLWNEGMPFWLTASQIPEVAAALNAHRATAQPQPAPAYSAPQQPQYGAAAPSANGYRALPRVDIKTAIIKAFNPYFNFKGRARRSEFWWFTLVGFCVSLVCSFLDNMINSQWISAIFSLAVFIPSLALITRRLHDIGESGWVQLISIIPNVGAYLLLLSGSFVWMRAFSSIGFVGTILLFILCAKDGKPQPNEYGPSPKYYI